MQSAGTHTSLRKSKSSLPVASAADENTSPPLSGSSSPQPSFFKTVFGGETSFLEPPSTTVCPFSPNRPPLSSLFPVSSDDNKNRINEDQEEEDVPKRKRSQSPSKISAIVSENKEILASISKAPSKIDIELELSKVKEKVDEEIKEKVKKEKSPEDDKDFEITESDKSKYLSFLGPGEQKSTPKDILEELKEKTKVEYTKYEPRKSIFKEEKPTSLSRSQTTKSVTSDLKTYAYTRAKAIEVEEIHSKPISKRELEEKLRPAKKVEKVEIVEEDEEELEISAELLPGSGTYYEHSPGEVYTIHEDANEASSPTTADGVSKPRRRGEQAGWHDFCSQQFTSP